MDLVVDANIIFSALIKDGVTIELFMEPVINPFVPEFLFDEISKYEDELIRKTKRTKEELYEILEEIKDKVTIIPKEEFESFLEQAEKISPDPNDVPYFALALKLSIPIWSNDKKLKEQNHVKIYSTKDLLYD